MASVAPAGGAGARRVSIKGEMLMPGVSDVDGLTTGGRNAFHGKKVDRRVINPESTAAMRWSLLVSTLILYTTFMVPFRIAFSLGTEVTSPILWIDLFLDLLFMMDIFVQTRLAFKLPDQDDYETSLPAIRWRYVRSWMAVDVLGAVPVDLVLLIGVQSSNIIVTKLFKTLRLVRMAKLVKVSRLRGLISDMDLSLNPGVRRMMETATIVIIVSHCTACVWYLVSVSAIESAVGDGLEADAWVIISFPEEYAADDIATLYLAALYWSVSTLTSVGFGDFMPANNGERAVATVSCWVGAIVFGYIIGQMSSMVADLNQASFQFHRKMDSINSYLKYRRVPQKLQKRIRRFFRYYVGRKMIFDEAQILDDLTHGLKVELSLFLTKDVLKHVHIFDGIDNPSFMSAIVTMLKPFSAAPGDYIVREGDIADEMYIIVRGNVEVLNQNGLVFSRLGQGSHFGEIEYLEDHVEERRAASARAVTYCDLFSFSKEDIAEVSRQFPEIAIQMQRATLNRKTIAKNLRTRRKSGMMLTGASKDDYTNMPDNPTGSVVSPGGRAASTAGGSVPDYFKLMGAFSSSHVKTSQPPPGRSTASTDSNASYSMGSSKSWASGSVSAYVPKRARPFSLAAESALSGKDPALTMGTRGKTFTGSSSPAHKYNTEESQVPFEHPIMRRQDSDSSFPDNSVEFIQTAPSAAADKKELNAISESIRTLQGVLAGQSTEIKQLMAQLASPAVPLI